MDITSKHQIFSAILISPLLFGVIFTGPQLAEASFLNGLISSFNEQALAQTVDPFSTTSTTNTENSQNIALLQSDVSVASLLDKQKSADKDEQEEIAPDSNIQILSGNALLPSSVNGAVSEEYEVEIEEFYDQISLYVVKENDTVQQIAKMFDISENTIYSANNLNKGDKLKVGDILTIFPFDSAVHTVKSGETLISIAKTYNVEVSDVYAFNGITEKDKLTIGEELIIPDGQKTEVNKKSIATVSSVASSKQVVFQSNLRSVDGYFIFPLPEKIQTQSLHDKYAKDYRARIGTPVYAAADGVVGIAKYGYNGGYGNFIAIIHEENGTETRYAHLSKITTSYGKRVSKGEVIGYSGNTGRSTGPHLHFEVRGGVKFPF